MQFDNLSLKHTFDNADLAGMARTQADKLGKYAQLETEMKSVQKGYQARIEEMKALIQAVSVAINSGFEFRTYKCLVLDERPEGFRILVRLDNGRIAKRRRLASEERQMTITTEQPEPYFAIALLPVDDHDWDTDMYQCPVREAEYLELKTICHFIPYETPVAAIEAQA